jgi:HSP20 family molecular chaperone IbpA
MSQVAIQKVQPTDNGAFLFKELKDLSEQIESRAFQLFQNRGGIDGFAKEDWLEAERNLFRIPESEITEKQAEFDVTVNAAGFEPNEVKVTALPESLIVRAKHSDKSSEQMLFRRFDLPASIVPEKVTADIDKGVLHVKAAKADMSKPKAVAA